MFEKTDALVERCARLVKACGGNCLVLFTSYEMLKDAAPKLRELVENEVFSQGESDSVKAVSDYCETPGAVLARISGDRFAAVMPGSLEAALEHATGWCERAAQLTAVQGDERALAREDEMDQVVAASRRPEGVPRLALLPSVLVGGQIGECGVGKRRKGDVMHE